MHWYARQVAYRPGVVILIVLLFAGTCIIVSFTTHRLPTMTDPLMGFEPRGTLLAQRDAAWKNLIRSTRPEGPLAMLPTESEDISSMDSRNESRAREWTQPPSLEEVNETVEIQVNEVPSDRPSAWFVLETDEYKGESSLDTLKKQPFLAGTSSTGANSGFFCGNPSRQYIHVIFQSRNNIDLYNVRSLKSICKIEDLKLRDSSHFSHLCLKTSKGRCCQSWSLSNYIALLANRTSCHDITQQDVVRTLELLSSCATYYHNLKLSHDCTADPALCARVPKYCIQYNAVYNILHYLTDATFMGPQSEHDDHHKLTYTSVFMPVVQGPKTIEYFEDLEKMDLRDELTEVVAMKLGLKYALFNQCLIHDTIYVCLAGSLVFLFIWMYTTSFFVTLMTLMTVACSVALAYFMYTVVYQIPFFPFMNLITLIIITGIGVDDSFIYCKIWACAKAEKNNGILVKLVRDTLHHACLSMFITSVTTAAAFFGSVISSITVVRCFSIFAGTAVLANFIFTVTWLPASVIIAERWCSSTCCLCIPPFGIYLPQIQRFWCCSSLCNYLWMLHYSFSDYARVFFEKILPWLIVKPRYFWLLSLTIIAIGGAVTIFYSPKLSLPTSREFQIFSTNHPFERYDLKLKKHFWFEMAKERELFHKMPIRIVWGVLPIENGNYFSPFDRGKLVLDPTFNLAAPESQKWLLSFCKQLRNQTFYQSAPSSLSSNCFLDTFKIWMDRRCVDGITSTDRSPCCESSSFPYSEEVFTMCIKKAVSLLSNTAGYYFIRGLSGPRFSRETGDIKAFVLEDLSDFTYSNSYSEVYKFRTSVETWVSNMMATAPEGLQNGWFTSDLNFFDLQDSLSQGTFIAIAVAISVAFLALLLTTLNLLVSLYAIITISFIILVVVGALVLLGWTLNVLECIMVAVAVGLSVDFTIHYAVAYRLSPQEDRESSIVFSLSRIGSPVTMAAFTTLMAGSLVLPSVLLAYIQIGTFLMLVMTISWLYATFFFQALLSLLGPKNGRFQLNYPTVHCYETPTMPVDKTPYAVFESTLSTSSAGYVMSVPTNENHELEPLTILHGIRMEAQKQAGKKHFQRPYRPRSESCSSALHYVKDINVIGFSNRTPRKVSLPTVSVTFHGENISRHVSVATSSSTILGGEDTVPSTPFEKTEDSEQGNEEQENSVNTTTNKFSERDHEPAVWIQDITMQI